MQVKCEVFSRFGNSVDFSSGELLGGVEAPAVGTLGLSVRCIISVRCIKGYSIVTLTGTDALPLDTIRASLQRVTRLDRASLL